MTRMSDADARLIAKEPDALQCAQARLLVHENHMRIRGECHSGRCTMARYIVASAADFDTMMEATRQMLNAMSRAAKAEDELREVTAERDALRAERESAVPCG